MRALDQDGREFPVHCAACLNLHGKRVTAVWVTSAGYLVCEEHRGLSVAELMRVVWKTGAPT
jgi:hypothetical protein